MRTAAISLALWCLVPVGSAQIAIAPHNGRGYEVVRHPAQLPQTMAEEAARARGAILGSPKDQLSNDFLLSLLTVGDFQGIIGPWLGGRQSAGAGEPDSGWAWPDGSPVAMFGQVYSGGWGNPQIPPHTQQQPNNGCGAANEDRMHFLYSDGPAWNDLPDHGCVQGMPTAWVAEYPLPFLATTTGSGTGDLRLELVHQSIGQQLPDDVAAVLIVYSATPASLGPGTGPLPLALVEDAVFINSLRAPLAPWSPLHFPVGANPYLNAPFTLAPGSLPAGLTLEFRAVGYGVSGVYLSGVSRVEV